MSRLKVTGAWEGTYWFDPIEGHAKLLPRVPFAMRLAQSWLFGQFTGEVKDDPPHGMPGAGRVEGRVTEGGVFFLKWMPVCYVWEADRPVPLTDFLRSEFGMEVDEPAHHPPIRYTGEYRPERDELEGTWQLGPDSTTVRSRGRDLAWELPRTTGRWVMRRVGT